MEHMINDLSVILVAAAVLSCLAIFFRQPLIIAYILGGILVGPPVFGFVKNVELIQNISHLGVTLLLFLAGLCLHPQKLLRIFHEAFAATLAVSLMSFGLAFAFASFLRLTMMESVCAGLAMMFSSTILTVKLLPTTRLHHQRMGAVCIGILIIQDLMAVAALVFLRSLESPGSAVMTFMLQMVKLAALIGALFLVEQYILRRIMARVDRFHEVLFMLGLAWCFGVAALSHSLGLFDATGAFFAGVVMARHPIALFISEELKPLRDFFLVLFFFALGAELNLPLLKDVFVPAAILAAVFVAIKPFLFRIFLRRAGETEAFAAETGFRLGQLSEFSLLIALLAFDLGQISERASQFIQLTTILTILISSYLVVFRFQTPIGPSEELIKD